MQTVNPFLILSKLTYLISLDHFHHQSILLRRPPSIFLAIDNREVADKAEVQQRKFREESFKFKAENWFGPILEMEAVFCVPVRQEERRKEEGIN